MTASTVPKYHKAAVLYGAKNLVLENIETPLLQPHEVQIAPRATGLCGTDQHYYQNGRNGIYVIKKPLVLGHEAAGEVVAVGSRVTNLNVGDRVAVEPQMACSACKHCRKGKYNLCPHMRFTGSASADPPAAGSLQKLWNHPSTLCYKLPDNVSFAEGAMVEPLSVALHSVRKARLEAGQSLLITGAGAIGLLCARIAKISGASSIVMVDVDESRLGFATLHGLADKTFKIPLSGADSESSSDFSKRMATEMQSSLKIGPMDAALECTGVETCINLCISAMTPGAKVVMVGMGRPVQEVNLGVALVREIEVIGVWRYTNTFQPAIELISTGMVDVKAMITHQFDLADVAKALELTLTRPADLVKCFVMSTD